MKLVVADAVDGTEDAAEDGSVANGLGRVAKVWIDLGFRPELLLVGMPERFDLKWIFKAFLD